MTTMTTYETTTYGRDDFGVPGIWMQTVDAATPADALTCADWTVEAARHEGVEGGSPIIAYRIRRPAGLADVLVERVASDPSLWLVSMVGQDGWVGTVLEVGQ